MKNNTTFDTSTLPMGLLNPEGLWAIEDELINIPLQFRESFWEELLADYNQDQTVEFD